MVGHHAAEQLQLRAFDPIQLDSDGAAGAAVRGIQNMRGQSSHSYQASTPANCHADAAPPLLLMKSADESGSSSLELGEA
jgi:hypothetical protein